MFPWIKFDSEANSLGFTLTFYNVSRDPAHLAAFFFWLGTLV